MCRKLKCHVVDCKNECVNVSAGAVDDPCSLGYFCDHHHAEFGDSELEPWKTELSDLQIDQMLISMPLQ